MNVTTGQHSPASIISFLYCYISFNMILCILCSICTHGHVGPAYLQPPQACLTTSSLTYGAFLSVPAQVQSV